MNKSAFHHFKSREFFGDWILPFIDSVLQITELDFLLQSHMIAHWTETVCVQYLDLCFLPQDLLTPPRVVYSANAVFRVPSHLIIHMNICILLLRIVLGNNSFSHFYFHNLLEN